MEEEDKLVVLSCIAELRSLTQLHFTFGHFHNKAQFRAMQQLGLLELKFTRCSGIAEALRQPDAFLHVKKLCISEDDSDVEAFQTAEERGDSQPDLEEVSIMSQAVFSLPSLVELSGVCRIFSLPAPDTWKLWSRPRPHCFIEQVWRKMV